MGILNGLDEGKKRLATEKNSNGFGHICRDHGKEGQTKLPPHAMTPAVQEVIIRPMTEIYLPPLHCAHPQAKARALDVYDKALAGFDRDTLQQGWQKVVAMQTYWVWPNPGVIAEACRQCQPRPKPTNEEEKHRGQALDMAEAYTARYMKTSHLAKLARQEGWSAPLRRYVADVAWVQRNCSARFSISAGTLTWLTTSGNSILRRKPLPPIVKPSQQPLSAARFASMCPPPVSVAGKRRLSKARVPRLQPLKGQFRYDQCGVRRSRSYCRGYCIGLV